MSPDCRQPRDKLAHGRVDIRSVATGVDYAGSQAVAPSVMSGLLGHKSAVALAPSNYSVISPVQPMH